MPLLYQCALLASFIGIAVFIYFRSRRKSKVSLRDHVILYQIGHGPHAPSVSPFPLKLETYLRMAKIPYENDHTGKFSSKGKTPWMKYNGIAVADSQFCIDYLNKKLGIDLSSHLTSEEQAIARAFQKMTEENLYWSMCYHTFNGDMKGVAKVMPYKGIKLWIVLYMLQNTIKKELWGHGMGRHTYDEAIGIGLADMKAISTFLGNKKFFMGEKLCEVDCAIFGMMSMILWNMPDSPHEKYMKDELTNLVAYCHRMKDEVWPDWNECLAKPKK